jgi:hypothetical protein
MVLNLEPREIGAPDKFLLIVAVLFASYTASTDIVAALSSWLRFTGRRR